MRRSPLPFTDPDDIVRYYLVLSESLCAPKTQSVTQSIGQRCRLCGGGPWTIRSNGDARPGRKRLRQVCATCDEPWDGEEMHVLKQPPSRRMPSRIIEMGAAESAMFDDWKVVRSVVENRPAAMTKDRWEFVTLALVAYLDPRVGTLCNVVAYGEEFHPEYRWTVSRVRTAIVAAREALTRKAARVGLIEKGRARR